MNPWQAILAFLTALLGFILKMMGKNKSAEEQLPDPSETEKAKNEADQKAEDKFGPRGKE